MTEEERMIAINEFLERNGKWMEKVGQKRAKVAHEVLAKRNKENTFHPRVDPVSEQIHSKKMKHLAKVA